MRNGAHWPNSGGSTMVGNSCASVCVRSTTRTSPEDTARANERRSMVAISARHLAFERFRVYRKPRPNVLGDIADKGVLDALLQGANHGVGERSRSHLRWRH